MTGFIKEVRQNKHGSLTGLSLEDIVANVSALVEQKKKVTSTPVDRLESTMNMGGKILTALINNYSLRWSTEYLPSR